MTTYDVVDQTVLQATPSEVETAIDDEAHGRSSWWWPWMRITPLEPVGHLDVGATMRFAVGNPSRWVRGLPRFTGRVTVHEPEHRVVFDYFEGAFRGRGEWVMEEIDEHHTRITFRWVARPVGSMRLKAHLVDVPTMHSRVMRKGFEGLDRHLAARRAQRAA